MNVKEYISSGIIESCVLGLASPAEQQDLEAMCASYPEIASAKMTFELSLEQELLKDAQAPPVHLKERIFNKLQQESDNTYQEIRQTETPVYRMAAWKWVAAASLLLLAGSVFWGWQNKKNYDELATENSGLRKELVEKENQVAQLKTSADMIENPTVKMASLKSMPAAPGASAKVFWDTTSKDVFLIIHNLPQPATDKQYQLWALLNNKPVDLGVFVATQRPLIIKMKNVQDAQAFAVTLEPRGGSPTPTGDMYVMGKL